MDKSRTVGRPALGMVQLKRSNVKTTPNETAIGIQNDSQRQYSSESIIFKFQD